MPISKRRPRFDPRLVHVGFEVKKWYRKLDFFLPMFYLAIIEAKNVAVASVFTLFKEEFESHFRGQKT